MKHIHICLFLLWLPLVAWSQTPALRLGYLGETGWHPGLKAGLEMPLRWKGKGGLIAAAELGGYAHRDNYRAFFTQAELGFRATYGTVYAGLFGGAGWLRSQLSLPTYTVDATGAVSQVTRSGRNHALFTLTGELGWQPRRWPAALHLRPAVWIQAPYNFLALPLFMLDAGLTIPLKSS